MPTPWFLATTPAPRPALPERRRRSTRPRWSRLAQAYVAWAERSHERLRDSCARL